MEEQLSFLSEGGGSKPTSPLHLTFREITSVTLNKVVVEHHYLHRAVNPAWCYGAYKDGILYGAISFAKPATPALCVGVCGPEARDRVYELNRLWMHDDCPKNSESRFIGWSLRQLSKVRPPLILVSYADTKYGHGGGIYRATNWIYTGLTKAGIKDKVFKDGRHPRSVKPEDRSSAETVWVERSQKHRFVYIFDNKDKANLRYPPKKYEGK